MAELTHGQRSIWIGQRLQAGSPLYNMAFTFVFPAELEPGRFREAWLRAVEGSEVLATRVVEEGGEPRRITVPVGPTEVLDFSAQKDPRAAFRRWAVERCAQPLPLDGPLVDSVLVRLGLECTGWYLNQHHLVTDAASTVLLYQRVAQEYGGLEGEPLAPYYATAEELRTRGASEAAREHWAERGGVKGPLYGRRAEPKDTASERLTLALDIERSRALDTLARGPGFASPLPDLSRFVLFATLLLVWLHRVGGRGTFDTPVAGRATPDSRRALGFFIEMFPFAVEVEPGDTLRTLGARASVEARRLLSHALPGLGNPSGADAGNVVLNFVPGVFGAFEGWSPEVEWVHPGHGDRLHALRLQVHDFGGTGAYTLHFDVNRSALPEWLRRRIPRHFERLLDALLEEPDRLLDTVDLRLEEERSLPALGGSPRVAGPTVVDLVEAQARRTPDRVALRLGEVELSYAQVLARVEALAAHLVERGIARGDRVALCGRRSMEWVVAALAVLRAGAAYVPLDSAAPTARRNHVLRGSGARLLLLGDGIDASDVNVPVLPLAEAPQDGGTSSCPKPEPLDAAYLIYTSGSTGQPKGVLVSHGGLAEYLEWASQRYVRGDCLTFPFFTSPAFDLTVTSLFLPLLTGGTLEIYPEPEGAVDSALVDVVRQNAVEFLKLTPSHLALLLELGLEGTRLRRLVVGGENLSSPLARAVHEASGRVVELHNEYGPTEAVVGCVVHAYDPEVDQGASVPIGAPAEHVGVEVLNASGTPVLEGVEGELWIAGGALARGYQGRPGLTADRFRPHPGGHGRRRYRSGDRVREVAPGRLEYRGRLDRQGKISGFRVEPAEVEAALLSQPQVERGVVVVRRRSALREGGDVRHCQRCGLPSNYPRASFDDEGVCSVCRAYERVRPHAQAYFKTPDDLKRLFAESAQEHETSYDCLMLLSGGKDSTYALCQLVEMGLRVYAFSLDNGFISEGAKANIRQVTERLGVPVEFGTTPAMNAVFKDSLLRFSNVCNGCFKVIYTLGIRRAKELGIPVLVTGLSRGQMFETRLTEEMFEGGRRGPEEVDTAVLAARKLYHRADDEVSRSMDVSHFADDSIFESVRIVDFYRYWDVGLEEVYTYLAAKIPWVRPDDTGRSTNCLINDVGIYVHKKERGFHNYALPYSWDVRLGHKTREEALAELDDSIDEGFVQETLYELGYDLARLTASGAATLEAFYVATDDPGEAKLRNHLAQHLPPQFIPSRLLRVESIPLEASGKVNQAALLELTASAESGGELAGQGARPPYEPPDGPVEEYLVELWRDELGADRVGRKDSFFTLGGTSLAAMQVMLRLCREFDIELPLDTPFEHPTLRALARVAEDRILADVEGME